MDKKNRPDPSFSRMPSSAFQPHANDENEASPSGIHHHYHHHYHQRPSHQASKVLQPSQRVAYLLNEKESASSVCHPIFSEIIELAQNGSEVEWKETARWLKFEEDVEEGSKRWSKPHVATLSLHALLELRNMLLHNSILLDVDADSFEDLVDCMLEDMEKIDILEEGCKEKVRSAILMGRGQPEVQKSESFKQAVLKNFLTDYDAQESDSLAKSSSFCTVKETLATRTKTEVQSSTKLMKQIPPQTEASNILLGEIDCLKKTVSAFVRLSKGVTIGEITEIPVPSRFLFMLLGPEGGLSRYHEIGRAVATLMTDDVFNIVAYRARNRSHILAGFDEFLDSVTVLPPGEWDPSIRLSPPESVPAGGSRRLRKFTADSNEEDEQEKAEKYREQCGLFRTGHLFGGVIYDLKTKLPWYWSDFKDGLSIQAIATSFYLYFACLAPTITFGGLFGKATNNHIGALESLISAMVCGVTYALFSGQPLSILGATGPVLIFEDILYDFCEARGWNYLTFRLWVGFWIGIILIILVAFDGVSYICFITRFTEDTFAVLIAIIFMKEAVDNVLEIGQEHPVNPLSHIQKYAECQCTPTKGVNYTESIDWPSVSKFDCKEKHGGTLIGAGCQYFADIFLACILITSGTCIITFCLKALRTMPIFSEQIRIIISDFAVIIGMICMTAFDRMIGVATPKLKVPSSFTVTDPKVRAGWIINPMDITPWWLAPGAFLPAIFGSILFFMDQTITLLMVNRIENKLKKGCGYHLDLLVMTILIPICSLFGLPWFVAGTVLSLNHVNSLKLQSTFDPPGQKPQFLGIREQRMTALVTFSVIGLSVFMVSLLQVIPMPVLYGVFFYMGASILKGIHLVDRTWILFIPPRVQPDLLFLRKVPLARVNFFTFIQIACFAALWGIKSIKNLSILFPLMLVVMVAVRKLLDYVFTQDELKYLDQILPRKVPRKGKVQDLPEAPRQLEVANLQVTLSDGQKFNLPVDTVNITEELNKMYAWHHESRRSSFSAEDRKSHHGCSIERSLVKGTQNS